MKGERGKGRMGRGKGEGEDGRTGSERGKGEGKGRRKEGEGKGKRDFQIRLQSFGYSVLNFVLWIFSLNFSPLDFRF